MATDAEIEDAGTPLAGKRKKLIAIAAAAGLAVLAGGGALYYFTSSPVPAPPVPDESFIFNLPTMTVNLNTADDSESYLQLSIALEVADEEMMHEIQPRLARVIDAFQVYLRELRRSDLEGSAGIYRVREELLRRVNTAIYPSRVDGILFRELLVQ